MRWILLRLGLLKSDAPAPVRKGRDWMDFGASSWKDSPLVAKLITFTIYFLTWTLPTLIFTYTTVRVGLYPTAFSQWLDFLSQYPLFGIIARNVYTNFAWVNNAAMFLLTLKKYKVRGHTWATSIYVLGMIVPSVVQLYYTWATAYGLDVLWTFFTKVAFF